MLSENEFSQGDCAILLKPLPQYKPLAPYPGMLRKLCTLLSGVSCTTVAFDDNWLIISPDGRRITVPKTDAGIPVCSSGAALAMAELRVTMGSGPIAFAIQEGTGRLWHRRVENGKTMFHPIASIEAEFGIPLSDHLSGIDEFVQRAVERVPEARLVLGVKFANQGFARTYCGGGGRSRTTIVHPDDPRFSMIWSLDLSHISYCDERVKRFQHMAHLIVDEKTAAEVLARSIAAPVCQPYMHGAAFFTGPGGNGKGLTIRAIAALYKGLASSFNLASLLGVARSSSTTNDQASVGLLTGLLAYDSDAVNPGQGLVENLKKATAGETLSMRLLKQNVSSNTVTAFMIMATNRSSTLPSTPEWKRRIWNVPFRSDTTEEAVMRWAEYLGDGTNPDDGIIDALMAGAVSFAYGHPDPVAVNRLTEGLTLYGQTVRDLLMSCAPLGADGLPDRPRVPVSCPELKDLRVGEKERADQLSLMGLTTASKRDVHGDGRTRQVICIKDVRRFEPFADEWRKQDEANRREQIIEDKTKAELVGKARGLLLDAKPLMGLDTTDQIRTMQSIPEMDGWILTPKESQWEGKDEKGIRAHWQDDETIRNNLRSYNPADAPEKYGFSAGSGLIIIDCDAPKDKKSYPEHGVDTLAKLGITLDDLRTLALRSMHGVHLVYRLPADWIGRVKASTHVHGTNIDLRPGRKSYVVGPGSHWVSRRGTQCTYPGIIMLPPETLIDSADESSQKERRIPLLPSVIAEWIASDSNCLEKSSVPEASHPASVNQGDGKRNADWHVDIPPMGPGATHDAVRDTAMKIAGIAAKYNWPDARRNAEMDRLRAAVPASHDPQDTERVIASAIRKASGR